MQLYLSERSAVEKINDGIDEICDTAEDQSTEYDYEFTSTDLQKTGLVYDREKMKRRMMRVQVRAAAMIETPNLLQARIDLMQTYIDDITDRINQIDTSDEEDDEEDDEDAPVTARTQTTLQKDELIDGICVAVQRAHSLRILHRHLSLDSFVVVGAQVKLADWSHSVFNSGNSSFKTAKNHKFRDPNHYVTPEMAAAGDVPEMFEYGFEYDMWGVGQIIFEILYGTEIDSEVDPGEFTNEWLATWISTHDIEMLNAQLYKILLKVLLTTDATKRASSYAVKNMCDGPQSDLFEKQQQVISQQDVSQLDRKFDTCPDMDRLLGNFIDDPRATLDSLVSIKLGSSPRGKCQCMSCARATCVLLPETKTRSHTTYVMRQLMFGAAPDVSRMLPVVVLIVFDAMAQAITNGDAPITLVDTNFLHSTKNKDTVFEFISSTCNGITNLRMKM